MTFKEDPVPVNYTVGFYVYWQVTIVRYVVILVIMGS